MADILHRELNLLEAHTDIVWEVADETARLALASPQEAKHVGGTCWQQDNNSFWKLVSTGPNVWVQLNATGTGGDVVGPAVATDNAFARFDTTTGKLIQDSSVIADDSGNITTVGTVDGRDIAADGTNQDNHIAAANPHSGSASSADLTAHTSDSTIHFTEASIDHTAIANVGTNTHAQIDSDIAAAIHDNVAGEITAVAVKASPVSADVILIEDSEDTDNKKSITVGSLPGGGVTDHGALTGLGDDDHTQYLLVDGTRAMAGNLDLGINNLLTAGTVDGRDVSVDGAAQDAHIAAANPHSDSASDTDLTAHTGDATIHFTEASIDHTAITNVGTNTHAQIDADIAAAIHEDVAGEISAIAGKGSPVAADVVLIEDSEDSYNKKSILVSTLGGGGGSGDVVGPAASTDNAVARFDGLTGKLIQDSSLVVDDLGNITSVGTVDGRDIAADGTNQDNHIAAANPHSGSASTTDLTTHTSDGTIHFTEGAIDHTNILSVGTNTHTQIDMHLAAANPHSDSASDTDLTAHTGDATIHFTEASIDHTAIANVGTNTHTQIDTHIANNPNVIDPTALTDGQYYSFGPIEDVTVDENSIGFSAVLAINFTDGHYDMANGSDGDGQIYYPRIAVEAGTGTRQVMRAGYIRNDTWNWTVGGELWISTTNGTLTQTAPVAPNYLQRVGYAVTADIILFDPQGAALKLTI